MNMEVMASGETRKHVIKMAAMGRRFQPGHLYDYRSDRTIGRDTRSQLLELSPTSVNVMINFKSGDDESINKFEFMKLDNHLQASVMAGLIDKYRGASNYVNDPGANTTQITRTLICRIKEKKEQLDAKKLNTEDMLRLLKEEEASEATHMVFGVTYGAEAYCVLSLEPNTSDDDDEASKKEDKDKLSIMVTKMENALADNAELDEFQKQLDEVEKPLLTRLKCRVYADGQSQLVRQGNIFDAYQHCLKFLNQFQHNAGGNNKTVPIKILLLPLKVVATDKEDQLFRYRDIDADLVNRILSIKTEMDEVRARARTMSGSNKYFREFEKTIQQYQKLVMDKLKEAVVNARASGADEEVKRVVQIVETHTLFKPPQVQQWIRWKQAEVKLAKEIATMSGIAITTDQKELENKLVKSKKISLVLTIPALDEQTNKMLKEMKEYLETNKTLMAMSKDDAGEGTQVPWNTIHEEKVKALATIRDLADHMKRNKIQMDDKNEQQYFIAYCETSTTDRFSYFYSIYYANNLVKRNLTALPCSPTGIQVYKVDALSSYRVHWRYEDSVTYPSHFQIEFRLKNSCDGSWTRRRTQFVGETEMHFQFEEGSTMEIRIAADTIIGIGEFSDVIDTQSVVEGAVNRNILNLEDLSDEEETTAEVAGPEAQTDYCHSQGELAGRKEVLSSTTSPEVRFAEELLNFCEKIVDNSNDMDIYAVPFTTTSTIIADEKTMMKRYDLDLPGVRRSVKTGHHRTILLMGATGSGKTTLINAMINYIFNVEWEDNFRFQLIDKKETIRPQWKSQTKWIKAYDIPHVDGFRVPYSLTIVDTPGYSDTNGVGLDMDKKITKMIHQFFKNRNGIQEVDVIGFVLSASLPRLTITQKYIFDSVMSIFGNDVKENINFLLTHSDSSIPPVFSAIAEADLPCLKDPHTGHPLYHKFNSSGFFCSNHSSNDSDHRFNKLFWDLGMKNFEAFFNMLAKMHTKSLSLTKEVLEERTQLETTVYGLGPLIKNGLAKMEEMRKTRDVIRECQSQIENHENVKFNVKVNIPKSVEIPNGTYVTNCNRCNFTCHYPCTISDNKEKSRCHAMTYNPFVSSANRTCRICPENCIWSLHSHQSYKWEYVTETRKISSDAIKKKYEEELRKKLSAEELIKFLEKDVEAINRSVLERVEIVSRCIKRLDEIALRHNPFSTLHYIDLIIETEKIEKRKGFVERIISLMELREMTKITIKVTNNEPLL